MIFNQNGQQDDTFSLVITSSDDIEFRNSAHFGQSNHLLVQCEIYALCIPIKSEWKFPTENGVNALKLVIMWLMDNTRAIHRGQ